MKKTVFAILILCLAVGLPLMALDLQQRGLNKFRVPQRFAKITVDLNTHDRTDELLLERQLSEPAKVEIMMQSDSAALKQVRFVAESEILGLGQPELEFMVGQVTGTASMASTTVLPAGRYAIYLTSHKHAGQLVIGYQEHPIDPAEFVRLSRIHQGDLNNPPSGYTEVFSADLTELEVQNQVIYSLSVKNSETIGISVYTGEAGNGECGHGGRYIKLDELEVNRAQDLRSDGGITSRREYQIADLRRCRRPAVRLCQEKREAAMKRTPAPTTSQANAVFLFAAVVTLVGSPFQPRIGFGANLWVNEYVYILLPALLLPGLTGGRLTQRTSSGTSRRNRLISLLAGVSLWITAAYLSKVGKLLLDRWFGGCRWMRQRSL